MDEATDAAKDGFEIGGMFWAIFGVLFGLVVIVEPSSPLKYVLQVGGLGAAIGLIGGSFTALFIFVATI